MESLLAGAGERRSGSPRTGVGGPATTGRCHRPGPEEATGVRFPSSGRHPGGRPRMQPGQYHIEANSASREVPRSGIGRGGSGPEGCVAQPVVPGTGDGVRWLEAGHQGGPGSGSASQVSSAPTRDSPARHRAARMIRRWGWFTGRTPRSSIEMQGHPVVPSIAFPTRGPRAADRKAGVARGRIRTAAFRRCRAAGLPTWRQHSPGKVGLGSRCPGLSARPAAAWARRCVCIEGALTRPSQRDWSHPASRARMANSWARRRSRTRAACATIPTKAVGGSSRRGHNRRRGGFPGADAALRLQATPTVLPGESSTGRRAKTGGASVAAGPTRRHEGSPVRRPGFPSWW